MFIDRFLRLTLALLFITCSFQASASNDFDSQAAVNQLLLSQKVTTLLSESMDTDENWVFERSGVFTNFENGKFSLRWNVGNVAETSTPAKLLSSLPILPDPNLEADELRLTVVYSAAYFGIPMIEDEFVSTGLQVISYNNILMKFSYSGFGPGVIGTRDEDCPLVIKLHYDISSGSQTMTVNGKFFPFQRFNVL